MTTADLPAITAAALKRLAVDRPRIHCITNAVATNLSANTLLAVGAHPSVTFAPDEVEGFAKSAAALAVNLGTLDDDRRYAIPKAIASIVSSEKPWALDPVMATRSLSRKQFAARIISLSPTVVRGNKEEIEGLGVAPGQARVVATTGATDRIACMTRVVSIANGHPLMDRVTAMGCAETALIAAFLTAEEDPFLATAAAILAFNIAGEIAAETATGPGSFQPALLDALYRLDEDTLTRRSLLS